MKKEKLIAPVIGLILAIYLTILDYSHLPDTDREFITSLFFVIYFIADIFIKTDRYVTKKRLDEATESKNQSKNGIYEEFG